MGWEAPWHWVVLAVVVIALFGYKKLPDASRSLGRSLRIFKAEIKGMGEDDKVRDAATTATPAVVVKPAEAAVVQPVVVEQPAPPPATVPSAEQPPASAS